MSIYPTLRYTDPKAAIAFLTGTLGFVEEHVTVADDGSIGHAELSFGGGVVMLGTRGDPPGPFDTGRAVTYLALDDPDAHHDRAVAAGAEITMALTDQPYGSREYAARDPEGNLWCFGTYRTARCSSATAPAPRSPCCARASRTAGAGLRARAPPRGTCPDRTCGRPIRRLRDVRCAAGPVDRVLVSA